MAGFSPITLGAAHKADESIASGYDHAVRTGDNTFSIYFIDGTHIDLTIPLPKDGAQGPQGPAGPAGPKGDKGNAGADGIGISNVEIDSSNHLIVTLTDGSTVDAGEISGGGTLVQVQADWNVTDTSSKAYIKNKPDLTTKVDKVDGKSLVSDTDIAQITTNKNAITTLNGNSTVAGSVDKKIADAIGGITGFDYEVVATLPTTGTKGKIYLVANGGTTPNIYDEYIWIGDKFEKIGTTEVDLTQYFKKDDVVTTFSTTTSDSKVASEKLVKDSLDDKADKSSVDAIYSDDYATKNLVGSFEDGKAMQEDGSIITESNFKLSDYIDVSNGIKAYLTICANSNSYSQRNIRIHGFNASKTRVKQIELIASVPNNTTVNREYELDEISYIRISLGINDTADVRVARNTTVAEEFETLSNANDDLKMLGWTVPSECPIQNYTDSNGLYHQRVSRVDLGSLSWNVYGGETPHLMVSNELNLVKTTDVSVKAKAFCQNYTTRPAVQYSENKTIAINSKQVWVEDESYTDADAFKSAMSGVYLYYELATEVTKSVDGNEKLSSILRIKEGTLTDSTGDYTISNFFDEKPTTVISAFYYTTYNQWRPISVGYAGTTLVAIDVISGMANRPIKVAYTI